MGSAFVRIHDGGGDKDSILFNGNTPPLMILSTVNQVFISYTSNGNGAGKGFSASFTFGKKVANFNFFLIIRHVTFICFFER